MESEDSIVVEDSDEEDEIRVLQNHTRELSNIIEGNVSRNLGRGTLVNFRSRRNVEADEFC
jgi:hypothetical protein